MGQDCNLYILKSPPLPSRFIRSLPSPLLYSSPSLFFLCLLSLRRRELMIFLLLLFFSFFSVSYTHIRRYYTIWLEDHVHISRALALGGF